jgi:hypothetical protein
MNDTLQVSILLSVLLMAAPKLWAQAANETGTDNEPVTLGEDRMLTPPPVSGQAYPVALDAQEHVNTLNYGVVFTTGYSDNVLAAVNGHPVSDINYSIWPNIGMDAATSRLHWDLNYAPGFTLYQHSSARNEADQNARLGFQYRLSPHVTFSAQDAFQKSSSVFNQTGVGPIFGSSQGPNESVIAPVADRLSNFGTVAITYQFAANDMIGAGGSFHNLHYPDPTQVPGLCDASSQLGSAFFAHRFSREHYVGATYQYQRLLSYPGDVTYETQTHAALLFYTVYPTRRLSMSFFGGPQLSDTVQPGVPSLQLPSFSARNWTPEFGASADWEGHFVSAALSYFHAVSGGSGLTGASRLDNATGVLYLQFSKNWTASLSGFYANNNVIGHSLASMSGHTYSGMAGLERRIGERVSLQLGYARLHQNYQIPVIAGTPDTNREFVSLSYTFARPLGR